MVRGTFGWEDRVMILFDDEDAEYARWLDLHPNGYVINVKTGRASYASHRPLHPLISANEWPRDAGAEGV